MKDRKCNYKHNHLGETIKTYIFISAWFEQWFEFWVFLKPRDKVPEDLKEEPSFDLRLQRKWVTGAFKFGRDLRFRLFL